MNLSVGDYLLWFMSLALTCISAVEAKRFPAFRAFMCFSALRTVTLMFILWRFGRVAYFWGYWTGVIVSALFVVFVISELYAHALKPYWTIPRNVMAAAIFALGLVMAGFALSKAPHEPYEALKAADAAFSLANKLALLTLAAVCLWLNIPWRSHAFCIFSGTLFYTAVQSITGSVVEAPAEIRILMRSIGMAAFLVANLWWIRGLSNAEAMPAETTTEKLVFARKAIENVKVLMDAGVRKRIA